VFYQLWLVGVAARHLEILIRRRRNTINMVVAMWYGIKGWNSFGVIVIYMFTLNVSSPYLLVFGDDRVRGTREQMML